jgi:hypothetical protein
MHILAWFAPIRNSAVAAAGAGGSVRVGNESGPTPPYGRAPCLPWGIVTATEDEVDILQTGPIQALLCRGPECCRVSRFPIWLRVF